MVPRNFRLKRELRQEMRARLAGFTPEAIALHSGQACERLCAQPEYRAAVALMIYLSGPHEIDTTPLALSAWGEQKRVLAPAVFWEQRRMAPIEIRSLETDVRPGSLGIREPVGETPVPIGEIDLIIVPGLAFDEAGNRLGRGRGFYDRFLAHRDFRAVVCGLAFEVQVVADVPAEPHDVRVDMLVTDVAVRRFTERGAETPAAG